MVTDVHSTYTTSAAPRTQWIEFLRGHVTERHDAPSEALTATELCGEVAEFMGMLDDED
jgi:hypothetical protein